MQLQDVFKCLLDQRASSMHLSPGSPFLMNLNGRLCPASTNILTESEIDSFSQNIMSPGLQDKFQHEQSINFTHSHDAWGRFRVSLYRQRGRTNVMIRPIADRLPQLQDLHLPPAVEALAGIQRGMIIFTGPAGSGKSTTIAAFINLINQTRRCHIVTLEDPLEYFHAPQLSLVSQREIGPDAHTFARALRGATRQDADVIVVGEMNDLETISIALTAAETGVLVLATMHTADCVQTITRLIGAFPSPQQQQARTQVAAALRAVICQHLVMTNDSSRRVPAAEIMVVTPGIQSLVRENKVQQIYSAIESGAEHGMQTLDQALQKLFSDNVISELEVVTQSNRPDLLRDKIGKTSIPTPEELDGKSFIDLGEEMISIDQKTVRYKAQFIPGTESYWTSSVAVQFSGEGLNLTLLPGMPVNRLYVSDFNIVGKHVKPFELPKRLLIRFRVTTDHPPVTESAPELQLKLFTQPESGNLASYNKINVSYPLPAPDAKWHTWVITLPLDAQGKLLKITMFEFPVFLTKVTISDIIFF